MRNPLKKRKYRELFGRHFRLNMRKTKGTALRNKKSNKRRTYAMKKRLLALLLTLSMLAALTACSTGLFAKTTETDWATFEYPDL